VTTPSGEFPWEAANATDGLAWYAGQGIGDWKLKMAENVFKSFLSIGLFALRVPFTDDIADAVIGPEAVLDGEIPSLEQVGGFLQGKWDLLDDISDAVQPIVDIFTALLKAFGGDFSGLADLPRVLLDRLASLFGGLPGLDVDDVFSGLESMFGGLFSDGGLDASKLIGDLPAAIVNTLRGLITAVFDLGSMFFDVGALRTTSANLLLSSDFKAAESMTVGDGWFWDGTEGRSAPGSAKATASGNRLVQLSNLVRVAEGQELDVAGWVKWSGVAASGDAFRVECQCYTGASTAASLPVGVITSPAASGGWQQINGQVTIPALVDGVRVRIAVEAAVTAGSVWWDDVTAVREGTMPQNFITNLIPDLAGLKDWIESLLNAGLGALGLPALGSIFDKIMDFADGLDDWMTDTDNTASGLDDLLGNLISNPAAVLGTIPQMLISGLDGALANLLPKTDWASFLTQFTAAGNSGTAPSTGIPLLDNALNALLGVRTTATTTQQTVQQQVVTMGTVDGLTVIRTPITSTQTWNRSAIPSGCTERVKTGAALVGSGQGGGRPNRQAKIATYGADGNTGTFYVSAPASGGVGGGYVYQEFDPATVGASQTVTIGAGGAGSTTQGADGSYGGTTSFGSLLSIASGSGGGVSMSAGVVLAGGGGNGGNGGPSDGFLNSIGAPSYVYDKGQQGSAAYRTQGGSAGTGNGGNGGAGQNGPTDDNYLTGGSGGGGGAGGGSGGGTGGAGGLPGGGGGAGGGGGNSNGANGGAGGRGEALVLEYFR
jgi:hypothetical protein